MKKLLLLIVALVLGASCAKRDASQSNNAKNDPTVNQDAHHVSTTPTPVATNDDSERSEKKKDVPPAFRNVDFSLSSREEDLRSKKERCCQILRKR